MAIRKSSSRGRQASKTSRTSKQSNKSGFRSSKRKPTTSKDQQAKKSNSDAIRLNKYIANAGICSRREADTYIKAGSATVNGKVVTEMGYRVQTGDEVRFDGSLISPETKRYVLLNKPKNYITTEDTRGRKSAMDLVVGATKERLYPVGRLDRNTTGLLLLTNDGDLAKKLTQPKVPFKKLYHVSLDKKLAMKDLHKLSEGIQIEGRMVFIDAVSYIENQPKTEIGLEIHSGRNRIVQKVFENFGYKVTKLDRVLYGGLSKRNLPRGHWRHLTAQEVNNLKMI